MNRKSSSFLRYGLPSALIDSIISKDLTISLIKNTSVQMLISKFELEKADAKYLKKALVRKPIASTVVDTLLINNNFTCCCCHGVKGSSYIIHHIKEYGKSQDNSYSNLAILCLVCHDLAHGGRSLTFNMTISQIRKAKLNWEALCKSSNPTGAEQITEPPIFETWRSIIDDYEDEPALLIDLTVKKLENKIIGYLQLINLLRGNTFIAGQFTHLNNQFDVDVKVSYWEMQWGIRSSLKKESDIIITYVSEDRILWRDLNHVFSSNSLIEFHKPKSGDMWTANLNR